MKCIICRQEKDESDEHIIPEALGNKTLITRRVCEKCNNRLGSNVDDYLTNHPIVKLIRIDKNLPGENGKSIKFFSGVEIDEKTGLKYDMRSGTPVQLPRIIDNKSDHIRIEASNAEMALEYFKKVMRRKRYSEEQIEGFCETVVVGEKEYASPPEFRKDATIDFSRLGLSAIKIAYEYSFMILGEKYLDDEIAFYFQRNWRKMLILPRRI